MISSAKKRTVRNGHKSGKITIENEKIYGCLEFLKVASDGSALVKVHAGDSLAGAVFEIYNQKGKLVDRITTDENGKAVTKKLPIGEYIGKEVTTTSSPLGMSTFTPLRLCASAPRISIYSFLLIISALFRKFNEYSVNL